MMMMQMEKSGECSNLIILPQSPEAAPEAAPENCS